MSAVSVTITLWTVWPLMSMPRMSVARACASSALAASLTPPALPRPPTFTCALTTTRPPSRSAIARASCGVVATPPSSTGKPCRANRSRPWYSYRSTFASRSLMLLCRHSLPAESARPPAPATAGARPIGRSLATGGQPANGKGTACALPHRAAVGDHARPMLSPYGWKSRQPARNPPPKASLSQMSDRTGDKDGRCPVGRGVAAGHRASRGRAYEGCVRPLLCLVRFALSGVWILAVATPGGQA